MSDITNSSEMSYDDAFKLGASNFEKTGTLESSGDVQASVGTEVDSNNNAEQQGGDNVDSQLQQLEQRAPAENTAQDASTHSPVNYQELYEQIKQEKDAQVGLLYHRLNDLSAQYQALKDTTVTSSTKESDSANDEYQESLREFKEVYPDIYKSVELLIKKEVDGTKRSVEDLVSQNVQPIKQYLEHNTRENYVARITNAHPDIQTLIDSGVVKRWVGSLDPVKQAGAELIMERGNADQVIQLLNEFKISSGTPPRNVPNNIQTTNNPSPTANNQASRDDEIAKRVMQMLSVPSSTPGMNAKPQGFGGVSGNKDNYSTDLLDAMRSWEKDNRR